MFIFILSLPSEREYCQRLWWLKRPWDLRHILLHCLFLSAALDLGSPLGSAPLPCE